MGRIILLLLAGMAAVCLGLYQAVTHGFYWWGMIILLHAPLLGAMLALVLATHHGTLKREDAVILAKAIGNGAYCVISLMCIGHVIWGTILGISEYRVATSWVAGILFFFVGSRME